LPKQVEGRYGPQMMYALTDERVMYVPLIVADRIRDLDIGPDEPFEVCKAEIREGNRRWIEWRVQRVQGSIFPVNEVHTGEAAADQKGKPNGKPNGSSNSVTDPNGNGRNGTSNQNMRFTAASNGALLPVPVAGRAVTAMETALNAATEIAHRVESRAAFNNHAMHFTNEDVRAIGLTIFIQAMREGSTQWDA
jgi:hypothetical protein